MNQIDLKDAAERGKQRRERLEAFETLRVAKDEIARLEAENERLADLIHDLARELEARHGTVSHALLKRVLRLVGPWRATPCLAE